MYFTINIEIIFKKKNRYNCYYFYSIWYTDKRTNNRFMHGNVLEIINDNARIRFDKKKV